MNAVPEPFKPALIMNGQSPADFEVTLLEPESHRPIKVKPAARCRFLVKIQMNGGDVPNSDIPPTFVFLKISKGSSITSTIVLEPFTKDGRSFIYSGQAEAPKKTGDYDVTVQVRYTIFDSSGGGPLKRLEPFQKAVKGAVLHVGD